MEPGVPFALLGAVVLLSAAAWAALAVTAVALGAGRRAASSLVAVGAVVLAAVDVVVALRFGTTSSGGAAAARAAGFGLLLVGVLAGGFRRRAQVAPDGLPAVVVPLAAPLPPSLVAGAVAAGASAAVLRARRDAVSAAVAAGLLVAGAAAALAPLADDGPGGARAVLLARGAGAALLLAGLVLLARRSLVAKVVAAILAGVLAMGAAAVGVVGTVVARSYDRQAASLVEEAADGRLLALQNAVGATAGFTDVLAEVCDTPQRCQAALERFLTAPSGDFAARVGRDGRVEPLGGSAPLTRAEQLALAGDPVVAAVMASSAGERLEELTPVVRLPGAEPSLAVLAFGARPADRPDPSGPLRSVLVYGFRLDDSYAANDVDAGGYGLSFLVGTTVVGSNLSAAEREVVADVARRAGVADGVPDGGTTVRAMGERPTVRFVDLPQPDGSSAGTMALSRDADVALDAQRDALRVLLLTALLATLLVGVAAVVLGRRTVEPVRRLTAAAERVRAGDLTSPPADPGGEDEVATLARAFGAMTTSLAGTTDELRGTAARLTTVLASMSDGLVAADDEDRVVSINPAALRMVGLPREADALGRPLCDVVDLRDGDGAALLRRTRVDEADGEVRRADGGSVPVRASLTPLETGSGRLLVLRDTTRERDVERMKTEFLSNVSHELRTPLTPIRAYADMIAAKPDLPPGRAAGWAQTILAESLKMQRVVDLLVDVAALEAGRVEPRVEALPVRRLLDARVAAWQVRAPDHVVRRRAATGLPSVLADPEWVGKALDELLDNATKHTPPGTTITLLAQPAPRSGWVRLSVRDDGPGIPSDRRDAVLASFEQVDGSATRRVGGLGLGLAFVRRLAQATGWELHVDSAEGKGCQVSLDLPEAPDAPAAPRRRRRVPAGS